jgi:choline dehydrogenase-like flavoprotein
VGKNFSANLGSSALVLYPDRRELFEGRAMGLEAFHTLPTGTPIKIAGQFAPDPYLLARIRDFGVLNRIQQSRERAGFWTSVFPSHASGTVLFPRFTKNPIIRFGMSERDLIDMGNANGLIEEECKKNGAVEVVSLTPPNQMNVSSSHIFGGAIFGTSASDSVVDMNLDVWGYHGLSIVDASVFPHALGVNPILSIATLAVAKARSLIRRHSS